MCDIVEELLVLVFLFKKAVKREIGVLRSNHTVPATVSERTFFQVQGFANTTGL